jgi:hypothetical protein
MSARITAFDTRSALGLARPRSISRNIRPSAGGSAVHYGGPAQRLSAEGHAGCRRRWRQWQGFHMGPQRGWTDIAYTGGFCDHGYALAGRGFGVRTAANGTNDANDRFYAFAWLGGAGEVPHPAALDALDWWVREAREHGGAGRAVPAHRDFLPTPCPGDVLTARARALHNRPIPPATPELRVEERTMVLVICPGKPLCLLTRGRLWPLETNAQGRAYEAAGVPRRNVTTQQWNDLDDASKHLASRGA